MELCRKIIFLYAVFLFIAFSCDGPGNAHETQNLNDSIQVAEKRFKIDLADKVFMIGPAIDSTSATIDAACDCCSSTFLTLRDSSFIMISYCIDGDSYSKGQYTVRDNKLTLRFDPIDVTKRNNYEVELDSAKIQDPYEVSNTPPNTPRVKISLFRSRLVLSLKYEGGTEYGIENTEISCEKFVETLKADSVWRRLNPGSSNQ